MDLDPNNPEETMPDAKPTQAKAESILMNLLPCPFCGGIDLSCDGHYVICDNCGATGPDIHPVPNGRKANELWNHREG